MDSRPTQPSHDKRPTEQSEKKRTGRQFPYKPKTDHPTEHRKRIDEMLKRSVYREPLKKPQPEVRP